MQYIYGPIEGGRHKVAVYRVGGMIIKRFISLSQTRQFKEDYELFDLQRNPTRKQIKEAYYRLAKEKHPDCKKSSEPNSFSDLHESYTRLLKEEATGKCSYNISAKEKGWRYLRHDGWYAGPDPRQSYFSETRTRLRNINLIVKIFFLVLLAGQIVWRIVNLYIESNNVFIRK